MKCSLAGKLADVGADQSHDFLRLAAPGFLRYFNEPMDAVFLIFSVHGFGDAVGTEEQQVAGVERLLASLVAHILEESDDGSSLGEGERFRLLADEQRRNATAIDVVDSLASGMDQSEEDAQVALPARRQPGIWPLPEFSQEVPTGPGWSSALYWPPQENWIFGGPAELR